MDCEARGQVAIGGGGDNHWSVEDRVIGDFGLDVGLFRFRIVGRRGRVPGWGRTCWGVRGKIEFKDLGVVSAGCIPSCW